LKKALYGLKKVPGQDMPNSYFEELGDGCPLILVDMFLTGDEKLTYGYNRELNS
jgi:hypothetical protein